MINQSNVITDKDDEQCNDNKGSNNKENGKENDNKNVNYHI